MGYHIIIVLFFLLISTCNGYSESGSTLFDNGIAEFQKGRYQDAVFWFTKLIEQEPFNAKAYKNRGVARLSLQSYDIGRGGIDDKSNHSNSLYNEEYIKALEDFNSALNLDPELEGIHSNMGVAWYYKGDYEKAIAEYGKEIEKHPENHSAFFNRAIAWVELKEYENALRDLQSVLMIKPDEYWAIAYQGDIYADTNNSELARKSYLAAMELNPENQYAREKLLSLNELVTKSGKINNSHSFTSASNNASKSAMSTANFKKKSSMKKMNATIPQKNDIEISTVSTKTPVPLPDKKIKTPKFTVQLGAFLDSKNSENLVENLKRKGYEPRVLKLKDKKNRLWTLVRTGGFQSALLAKKTVEKLQNDFKINAVVRPVGEF
ncbi:Tetratricopeptide repeat-containing protein [Desulfocicer vacuolatum DSM 3385]|uniref:Tetratricopeptide repeat-containing protein n=2 Tax=Desulfocicer vacuolatum TaxID=2298 RepID=A0A1W2AJZ2_9BACT|nr:Tetratricopeptide repeat-containing protein [Desulfocicer vacuolatum DSM 3385]